MITCNTRATFGSRRFLWAQLGLLALGIGSLFCHDAHAAPLAGTIISNMAIGEYKEEGSSVVQTSRSNLVQTTIIPVYTFTLTANRSVQATAGQRVFFSHELSNTGNSTDRYNLSAANLTGDNFDYSNIVVYLDANRDGVPLAAIVWLPVNQWACWLAPPFQPVAVMPQLAMFSSPPPRKPAARTSKIPTAGR